MKQSFSIVFIGKQCKCQCFIKGDDLWIKHGDYFSQSLRKAEDIGTPLEYRIKKYGLSSKKNSGFVYNDCWGDIVLRNEAWLVIENIIPQTKLYSELEVKNCVIDRFCKTHKINRYRDLDETWELFLEKVVKELYNLK